MIEFRIWIRSLGGGSRIRVEGNENNARWLVDRLSRSFVFKNSEPIREDAATRCFTFVVPYTSQTPRNTLERLLATIPEVTLVAEAA